MSRSNPSSNSPHPCGRWFNWVGDKGHLRFYDRAEGINVDVALPFRFLLLDQLAAVKGWHDQSDSGIFSNEVRSTKQDELRVKSFKGGELATGLYAAIREQVVSLGGHFVASLYIAYESDDGDLTIGNLQLKGSQLRAWSEFSKQHRKELLSKAIVINGFGEGKKGKVVYRFPKFDIADPTDSESQQALGLDQLLQEYLGTYLSRPKEKPKADEQLGEAPTSTRTAPTSSASIRRTDTTDAEADAIAAQQAAKDEFDDEIPF